METESKRIEESYSNKRHLAWLDCYNVRDLGGLPLKGGGHTRWGALIRADMLGRLTLEGKQQLLDYGVRTIIDLRNPHELVEEPPAGFPDLAVAPTYRNLPLEQQLPPGLRKSDSLAEIYRKVIDYNQTAVAQIMRAIIEAGAGGIVIHCYAGKDRTGMIAAMILTLAGVEREAVIDDYRQSQEQLWPLWEKMIVEAGGEENLNPWRKPVIYPESIVSLLDHLDGRYGGVEGYLQDAGLSAAETAVLKAKL